MNRVLHASLLMVASGCLDACMAASPETPPRTELPTVTTRQLQEVTRTALADAATRSKLAPPDLQVMTAEPVTWGDGSLGCPEEGMNYTQMLVPGFRIRIQAGDTLLEYHAGSDGKAFYCPPERSLAPLPGDAT